MRRGRAGRPGKLLAIPYIKITKHKTRPQWGESAGRLPAPHKYAERGAAQEGGRRGPASPRIPQHIFFVFVFYWHQSFTKKQLLSRTLLFRTTGPRGAAGKPPLLLLFRGGGRAARRRGTRPTQTAAAQGRPRGAPANFTMSILPVLLLCCGAAGATTPKTTNLQTQQPKNPTTKQKKHKQKKQQKNTKQPTRTQSPSAPRGPPRIAFFYRGQHHKTQNKTTNKKNHPKTKQTKQPTNPTQNPHQQTQTANETNKHPQFEFLFLTFGEEAGTGAATGPTKNSRGDGAGTQAGGGHTKTGNHTTKKKK